MYISIWICIHIYIYIHTYIYTHVYKLFACESARFAGLEGSAGSAGHAVSAGFAAFDERPFHGPLHAWSAAIQGKSGLLIIPTMLRVLMRWLADKLDTGDRLQRPVILTAGLPPLSFFADAKAESDRAWIGGFLEISDGKPGPWFSLEVDRAWAPWAFAKGDPKKVIAALELLATLVGIRLWVPEGKDRKSSRVAIRGYTDNKSSVDASLWSRACHTHCCNSQPWS